jgi:type IX secretion system PorP/SprF family membrane protein
MKKTITLYSLMTGSFLLSSFFNYAQQEYQFSNTVNNPFLLNPAAGGMTDVMQFEAGTRMQWLGYDGGPTTIMLSGHSQIKFFGSGESKVLGEFNVKDEKFFDSPEITTSKSKHIVGGKVWNDAIGPFSKTAIQGSYAYHLPLTKKLNFGAGIGLGFSNFRLNESRVVLHQADDNTYDQFLGSSSTQNMGDAQAGLVVYGERLFFGISGTQLLKNKVELNSVLTQSNMNRHAFMIVKYKVELSDDADIEPSFVLKTTMNSPISMDLGARYIHNNKAWAGVQYRTNSTLVLQVGCNLVKNLYFNYSYDHALGKLSGAGSSTHEFQLGYYLGKNRNVDKELKENQNDNK